MRAAWRFGFTTQNVDSYTWLTGSPPPLLPALPAGFIFFTLLSPLAAHYACVAALYISYITELKYFLTRLCSSVKWDYNNSNKSLQNTELLVQPSRVEVKVWPPRPLV